MGSDVSTWMVSVKYTDVGNIIVDESDFSVTL